MEESKATIVRRRPVTGEWWNLHPFKDHPIGSGVEEGDVVLRVYAPGASVEPEMQVAIVTTTKDAEGNRVEVVDRKWPHTAVPVELINPMRLYEAMVSVQHDLQRAKAIYQDSRNPKQSVFQMAAYLSADS